LHYFPDPDHPDFAPFAQALVRMIFAHAGFEHRVSELLNVITGDPDFGENPTTTRWSAKDRPKEVRKLCDQHKSEHPNGLPETDAIVRRLREAFPLCNERNLLAHGIWWGLDPEAGVVNVRAAKVRPKEDPHRDFTADTIQRIATTFDDLEADLYKLQAAIEARLPPEPLPPELLDRNTRPRLGDHL
jgi:hypothetical protein